MLSPKLGLCNWKLVQLPFSTLSLQDTGVSRNIETYWPCYVTPG